MRLVSQAFEDGERIPHRFTCDGEDEPPPLEWTDVPPGTMSFAIVCSDPDAPSGTFRHWAVYDIPVKVRYLPDRTHTGLKEAVNDFGRQGYRGPCPPAGRGLHRYRFRLYALDIPTLGLSPRPSCREVEHAARQHTLGEAELVGLFGR